MTIGLTIKIITYCQPVLLIPFRQDYKIRSNVSNTLT